MNTMIRSLSTGVACAALALVSLGASHAEAQWGPRVGVGYVVNAPNQYVGLSGHVLTTVAGGLGFYVDGKITRPSIADHQTFDPNTTAQFVDDNYGDIPLGDEEEYRSVNFALMRPLTPELLLYAGAGYTSRTVYVEYQDLTEERGRGGFYWVEDPDNAGSGLNVLFGGFFRIGRNVSLQFGAESQPRGVTVGASYAVPFGG